MAVRRSTKYAVTLPPQLVDELDQAIMGHYPSRSAAIGEAIRDLLVKLRRRSLPSK